MKKTTEIRINTIQTYLIEHGKATVKELASYVNVTPEMIRKDLNFLEEKGFLFRTHGGAVLRDSTVDIPLSVRSKEKTALKKELCQEALKFINDDNSIFVDPSSTYLYLGQIIRLKKNIVIVSNCFDFIEKSKDSGQEIYFLGGLYTRSGNRTGGQFSVDMIEKFNFDVAFFGSDGLMMSGGVGTQSQDAVFLNEAVMKRSKKRILVVDSSKFERRTRYSYADLNEFDVLITDFVPDNWKDKFEISNIIELNKLK